ncbi:MAG: YraN family protein [Burkholderiales bacterium]|nr:MAG: YraN family protein [Burkholderiales bacterium]
MSRKSSGRADPPHAERNPPAPAGPTPGRETERQRLGREAEDRALALLVAHGLEPVARNVRYRFGELDLVMRDGAELVFVEVRWRAGRAFGGAAASVTPAKQRRLRHAAQRFLLLACGASRWPACRFDVVALGPDGAQWLRGAFEDGGR